MCRQEGANLARYFIVRADVAKQRKPFFQLVYVTTLARYDPNNDLGRELIIGPVQGNCRDGITAKTFARALEQRVLRSRFDFHHQDKQKHPTSELTRPRDSVNPELIEHHEKHAPAARVQRFVGMRSFGKAVFVRQFNLAFFEVEDKTPRNLHRCPAQGRRLKPSSDRRFDRVSPQSFRTG